MSCEKKCDVCSRFDDYSLMSHLYLNMKEYGENDVSFRVCSVCASDLLETLRSGKIPPVTETPS